MKRETVEHIKAEDRFLTATEIARLLNIPQLRFMGLVHAGKVKPDSVAGNRYFLFRATRLEELRKTLGL